MSERPTGQCALCLKEADLCRSHLISKRFYDGVKENGKTIKITENIATIPPGGGQATCYLLCKHCEDHFSRFEKIVLKDRCRGNDEFPLLEKAKKATNKHYLAGFTDSYTLFPDSNIEIDWKTYTLFALSVFWRCSVVARHQDTKQYFNAFGKYQEDIRKLLLSNEKNDIFPENMYLMIVLDNGFASMDHIITAPSVDNCVKYHMHNFVVPKTLFCLLVGNCIPESLKKIHRHKGVCSILVTDVFKTDYGTSIIKKILGATPRGGAKGFI